VKPEWLALLVGGVLPALCFGVDGLASKLAARAGLGLAPLVVITGLCVTLGGVALYAFGADRTWSHAGAAWASAKGLAWVSGTALVVFAITRLDAPLAKIAPIYATSVIISVVLALALLGEAERLAIGRLVLGVALAVVGLALVASA
jgi:uncharacterized membrane protein